MKTHMNTVPELIDAIQQGKMVILLDDEKRENEGDLIMAASCVTPEAVNFMIQKARGLLCVACSAEVLNRLSLAPVPSRGHPMHATAFVDSVDAVGTTTGISAHERAHTINMLAKPDATAEDFLTPGHVFPLREAKGRLPMRQGHTEAACALARLAGFVPVAAIIEIIKDDGTMARLSDLQAFAHEHDLPIGTIPMLLEHVQSLA